MVLHSAGVGSPIVGAYFLPCSRAFNCAMTFSSARLNEFSSVCGSLRRSMSCRMSTRSLRARQFALGRIVDELPECGLALADTLASAILGDYDQLIERLVQQRRQVFCSGGPASGLPDWPLLNRVSRGGLP